MVSFLQKVSSVPPLANSSVGGSIRSTLVIIKWKSAVVGNLCG